MTSFVGALNVGSIKLNFDPSLKTNTATSQTSYEHDKCYNKFYSKSKDPLRDYLKNNHYMQNSYKDRSDKEPAQVTRSGLDLNKGEEVGCFEMGSTIVLVFEGN